MLSQELEALGKTEERELRSQYRVLLAHLLKWLVQPERRSRSWELTILNQRDDLAVHLADNPGLKRVESDEFATAYRLARRDAAIETDLDIALFSESPPFTMDGAKNESFWPQ